MIVFTKWAIRFIVWILLYYIVIKKLSDITLEIDNSIVNQVNIFILFISIGMSFLSSFWGKLISFKNIKYHFYSLLILFIMPIFTFIINSIIKLINLFTGIISAPQMSLINVNTKINALPSCLCENIIFPVIFAINFVLLVIFFIISYEEYYLDANRSCCGDGWDDDLE